MDPSMGPPGTGYPEDDKMRLGAQQAAIMQMQQEMEETAEISRAAMEAQQEVLALQQQALLEQENQKRREQQQLHMLQQQGDVGPPGEVLLMPPGTMPMPPMMMRPPMMAPGLHPPGMEGMPMLLRRDEPEEEVHIPQSLEKVLAFKGMMGEQMSAPGDTEDIEIPGLGDDDDVEEYAEVEEEEISTKKNKQKDLRNKKKKKKKKKKTRKTETEKEEEKEESDSKKEEDDVEVEYVQEEINLEPGEPGYREFARIFENFKIEEPKDAETVKRELEEKRRNAVPIKAKGIMNLEEAQEEEEDEMNKAAEDEKPKLSKKKMKKLNRLSVAELKQLVLRPDVVEMHDVTAHDPKLLVLLKSSRNTVPVPRHWCFKRKYLQGKRGFEKSPFELPGFIKATGIMEMRQALQDKEESKSLKSKMREKIRPKMGKIDIDYQKLHDAFFKFQTKPKMSCHGDLYYEGKEFETRLKEKKPGNLSDDIRTALGMPIGQNAEKYPPPWLIAMQRYGPPPSYPNLKIPGLNAPIPDGCAFGYHAGGWGKPPVDEFGKPLYGDVFGTMSGDAGHVAVNEDEIDKSYWGELESESEEEMSEEGEEEEDEDEEQAEPDSTGLVTPAETGLVTPSGVTSVPVGVETPDMIELRKRRIEDSMDQGGDTPALYQVLPEKKASIGAAAMMGSSHVYDIAAVAAGAKKEGASGPQRGVEVALNPEELDMDQSAMQAKYEQTMRDQQTHIQKEDLSDMVAEHAAQQKKRKSKTQDTGKSAKKYKEFKF